MSLLCLPYPLEQRSWLRLLTWPCIHPKPQGTQVHLVERTIKYPTLPSYHRDSGWSRDQPQPRSLFQRQREAEKRDPGNEIEQNTEYLCKCYRADVLRGWCAATRTSLWNSGYDVIMVTDSLPDLYLPKAINAWSPLCCHGNNTVDISWNFEIIAQQLFIVSVQCWKRLERYSTFCDFKSLCVHIVTSQVL